MRLFVALDLPEDLRDRLTHLQQGVPAARWVPPENMHLTLRFIGEVDGHQARDIDAALAEGLVLFGAVYLFMTGQTVLFLIGLLVFLGAFLLLPIQPESDR